MRYLPLVATALLGVTVQAHMSMVKPAPIGYKGNKYTETPDYNYASPLAADGSNYPCKSYNKLLGTPQGTPVETWEAGSVQTFTIGDGTGATHGGGSCQASISEDGGITFKVVKSFIGNCPVQKQTYSFTVPAETKPGEILFSWTWFNKIGNREMYMNCAAITVTGGGAGLSAYPDVFKANIGGTCSTPEGIDVVFPSPGKDVETAPGSGINLQPPVGECGPAGTVVASPSVPLTSVAPTSGVSSSVPTPTTSVPASSSAPTPATSVPVSSPATPTSLPAAPVSSASQVDGCVCYCGGSNGYIVNISPIGITGTMPPPSAPPATSTPATTLSTSDIEGVPDTASTDRTSAIAYRHRRAARYYTSDELWA